MVEKLVLKFVGEDTGDPFLQFDLLGWRQIPPTGRVARYTLLGTDISKFWSLFKTDRPNKTERLFEVVPQTTESFGPGFVGEPLDFIHVLVTDSAIDRMREVAPDTYAGLPAEAKGRVEYYRSGGGRQALTTRENYERLAEEKKGRIRYFQRERPRLAEVEVWTIGDNLNYQRVSRGGETRLRVNADKQNPQGSGRVWSLAEVVTDGDYSTAASFSAFGRRLNTFFEDLGTGLLVGYRAISDDMEPFFQSDNRGFRRRACSGRQYPMDRPEHKIIWRLADFLPGADQGPFPAVALLRLWNE